MTRRLKVYRENNVPETHVHTFFQKLIGEENVKIEQFDKDEKAMQSDLMSFLEQNGKPCCLNLITESDKLFLLKLEKHEKKIQMKK